MPLKIKKILKGLVLLVCVSYWESFTFNLICGLLQIPGTNHIMKSCSWDIGCVLLMLKEDPLREPLSGGERERKRERKGRGRKGRVRKRKRGGERERERESYRMGKGGKERQRGGEGGSSQAALYPDRSPLHTNFLVKEEKMALNPEKSFSPGAGLSAEGWVDTSRAFLLGLAPSGTPQLGYRSQQSSLSIAVINTPSEYNEPYHDTWISADLRQQSFNCSLEIKCEVNWFFDHVISITNSKQIEHTKKKRKKFHAQLPFINIQTCLCLTPAPLPSLYS